MISSCVSWIKNNCYTKLNCTCNLLICTLYTCICNPENHVFSSSTCTCIIKTHHVYMTVSDNKQVRQNIMYMNMYLKMYSKKLLCACELCCTQNFKSVCFVSLVLY